MDPINQNGVTFSPEKVVDLDKLFSTPLPPKVTEPEEKKVEPVTTEPIVEPVKADTPEPVVTPEPAATPEPVTATTPELSLDEISLELGDEKMSANEFLSRYETVKNELEEIKGDEFLNKFIAFRKTGGDPAEFLSKATAKWDQQSEISLLRNQFESENTDLDGEVKEILFERKLRELYGVNPDGSFDEETSREAKVGRQLMQRDANKYRATKIEEQKSFLLSQEKPVVKAQPVQYDPEKARQELLQDKELQGFLSSKSLTVGEGLSYEVEDPNKVIGMMANVGDFWKMFAKPDGSYDKQALAKVFSFALNPKKYEDAILKLGKDSGGEEYLKEQKNTSGKTQTVINNSTDKDEVVVRNGKIISTGNNEGFLKAAVAQKRR
jgi:hypothetical protein